MTRKVLMDSGDLERLSTFLAELTPDWVGGDAARKAVQGRELLQAALSQPQPTPPLGVATPEMQAPDWNGATPVTGPHTVPLAQTSVTPADALKRLRDLTPADTAAQMLADALPQPSSGAGDGTTPEQLLERLKPYLKALGCEGTVYVCPEFDEDGENGAHLELAIPYGEPDDSFERSAELFDLSSVDEVAEFWRDAFLLASNQPQPTPEREALEKLAADWEKQALGSLAATFLPKGTYDPKTNAYYHCAQQLRTALATAKAGGQP